MFPDVSSPLRDAAAKFRTELTGHPLARAKLLSAVGNSLNNLGDHQTAGPLLSEALSLRRADLPADHPDVVRSELDLGRYYWHLGDFTAAIDRFRSAHAAMRRVGFPETEIITWKIDHEAGFLGSSYHYEVQIQVTRYV